ncbi:MAG: hypothetical protein WCG75_12900, partial [Armatimonadota bacterium]
ILVPFIIFVATPEAATITARIEATHAKMTKASVMVSDGLTNVIPTKIKFSPGICTLEMPNLQIVEVKPNAIRFYDELLNQVATLNNKKPAKVPDSASKVAIVQQEPIAWLVDSAQKKAFFAEMKQDKRWQVRGSLLILLDPKRKTLSEVHFDNSYRVTEIKLRMNDRPVYDWKYLYASEGSIPSIPATASAVKGLNPRPSIPPKTDGPTVLYSQKVWRFLSRMDGKKISQSTEEGTYSLSFGKGKISESGPNGSWSLADRSLVINPKSGSSKTYKGGADKALDLLKSRNMYASPIARYVLNRKIPFLDMFDRTDEVKLVNGIGNIDGKNLSVISMKRAGIRIRMYADPQSGEVDMISSDAQDSKGNFVSGTRLKIKYQ